MRVAAVGNCQMIGIGECLADLLPDAEVRSVFTGYFKRSDFDQLLESLVDCDHLFTQAAAFGDLPIDSVRARAVHILPTVVFTGFHPDVVLMPGFGAPTGSFHSGIAICAYLMGLSPERASSLYNAFIYAALGYFREYDVSRRLFLRRSAELGFDLTHAFARWEEEKPFLYSVNHPKPSVLASIAELAVEKAGLARGAARVSRLPYDMIGEAGAAMPVYPEIGSRIGIDGELAFPFSKTAKVPDGRRSLSVLEFVTRSYVLYEAAPRDRLERVVSAQLGVLIPLIR